MLVIPSISRPPLIIMEHLNFLSATLGAYAKELAARSLVVVYRVRIQPDVLNLLQPPTASV